LYPPNASAYLTLAAGLSHDHPDYVSSDDREDEEEEQEVGFRGRSASVDDDFVVTDEELSDGSHLPAKRVM
jgi:hypothetical protein